MGLQKNDLLELDLSPLNTINSTINNIKQQLGNSNEYITDQTELLHNKLACKALKNEICLDESDEEEIHIDSELEETIKRVTIALETANQELANEIRENTDAIKHEYMLNERNAKLYKSGVPFKLDVERVDQGLAIKLTTTKQAIRHVTCDLVYMPDGSWLLLKMKPKSEADEFGRLLEENDPREFHKRLCQYAMKVGKS